MSDLYINKYIWDKKLINNLYKSCSGLFNMNNLHYNFHSLYFHIYNTKNHTNVLTKNTNIFINNRFYKI